MRINLCLLLSLLAAALSAAPLPPEVAEVLRNFRTEGPRGWRYTETTTAGAESLVERYDPLAPETLRWTLVRKNGRAPTDDELRDYRLSKVQRSSAYTAPSLPELLDFASAETLPAVADCARYRFRLKPGEDRDRSAEHLRVTATWHRPSRTITEIEIASVEPFSPVFGIRIAESRTVLRYALPADDRPSLLQTVTLRVRGRAFWLKSLDQDMQITFSDYTRLPERNNLPTLPRA
jgi:hypothetical protein